MTLTISHKFIHLFFTGHLYACTVAGRGRDYVIYTKDLISSTPRSLIMHPNSRAKGRAIEKARKPDRTNKKQGRLANTGPMIASLNDIYLIQKNIRELCVLDPNSPFYLLSILSLVGVRIRGRVRYGGFPEHGKKKKKPSPISGFIQPLLPLSSLAPPPLQTTNQPNGPCQQHRWTRRQRRSRPSPHLLHLPSHSPRPRSRPHPLLPRPRPLPTAYPYRCRRTRARRRTGPRSGRPCRRRPC